MVGHSFLAVVAATIALWSTVSADILHAVAIGSDISQRTIAEVLQAGNACKLGGRTEIAFNARGKRKSTGAYKAGMLFVDFPDAPAKENSKVLYDHYMPRAAAWYSASSYGRLQLAITAPVSKFLRMPTNSTGYGWSRSTVGLKMNKYINDAITAAGSTNPFGGNLDALYIVPTRSAKAIWFSPTYVGPSRLPGGSVASGAVTFGQDAFSQFSYKILNHETTHLFGLPDLYPADSAGKATTHYVGGWSLMGLISGTAPDLFAWEKWRLGWLDDDQVSCISSSKGTTQHILTPLSTTGGLKMVTVKLSESSILAIELRTKTGLDVDTCSQGLLFYLVDLTKPGGRGPITVIDPRASKARSCNSQRGGQLSAAAMDFAKGERQVSLSQYGVQVSVSAVTDGKYVFSLTKS